MSLQPLTVDYDLTQQEMIGACQFLRTRELKPEDIVPEGKGKVTINVGLVSLDRTDVLSFVPDEDLIWQVPDIFYVPTETLIAGFNEQGFRPATIFELLAFAASHKDLPEFPDMIFALASPHPDPGGKLLVPHVDAIGGGRGLGLHFRYEDVWQCYRRFQFLIVQK